MTRALTDRVRNDGNWIYGDPDFIAAPGELGCMMNATHIVGAPPLPDFEGWVTPRYGFSLYLLMDQPTVMSMSYYGERRQAPVQLSLFEIQTV